MLPDLSTVGLWLALLGVFLLAGLAVRAVADRRYVGRHRHDESTVAIECARAEA